MENIEYGIAYKEVLEILKYISKDEYNKIPVEKIELFKAKADESYEFKYNPALTLQEQKVSKRAKAIIAILFRDCWATQIQKEKILNKQKYDRQKIEEEKLQNYKPDDLFKKHIVEQAENTETNNITLVEYKESIWKRLVNRLKILFHIR